MLIINAEKKDTNLMINSAHPVSIIMKRKLTVIGQKTLSAKTKNSRATRGALMTAKTHPFLITSNADQNVYKFLMLPFFSYLNK